MRMVETVSTAGTSVSEQVAQRARALASVAKHLGPAIAAKAPAVVPAAARLLAEDASGLTSAAAGHATAIGLSAEMVREAIHNLAGTLRADALASLVSRLRDQAGNASIQAPRIVFHVLAGNLFVAGIESMVHASLIGACSLVRCSSADPVFPRLWRDALALADSEFADSIAIGDWPSEDETATRRAIDASDCVVAFGDDSSVSAVRALTPPSKRFVGHGFKISIALVGRDALSRSTVHQVVSDLAYDFSVYDQQGCLSPRVAFIENGGEADAAEFASALGDAMRRLARALPRHALDLNEKAALAVARDNVLIRAATGRDCLLASGPVDEFLITIDLLEPFQLGSLNRHCDLRVFGDAAEIRGALAPYVGHISTVGVAGDWNRWRELCLALRPSRVCALGNMQRPPLGWIHDGNLPLMGLVDFCGYEFGR
jgi:hypothetical protein